MNPPTKLKEIFERRCCRTFDSSKDVTLEQMEMIMEAGQCAPSAKNRQPYHFIAIFSEECRLEIYEAAEEGRKKQFSNLTSEELKKLSKGDTGSNDRTIYEASGAILVLRVLDSEYEEAKDQSENLNIKEEQGVSNAAYSMMLQAQHMGLSTGWVCSPLYIGDEIKEILKRYGVDYKDSWRPRVIIPVGYCKGDGVKIGRDELEKKSDIIF